MSTAKRTEARTPAAAQRAIARDPHAIMLSAQVRPAHKRNYSKAVDEAAALGKEGLDLAIIYLPVAHDPAVLELLANEIGASGLSTSKGF